VAALVFDSGALIALERGDRAIAALIATAVKSNAEAVTSTACVAQVWRNPARQARLARALAGFLERDLDAALARDCGTLLAGSGTQDIVDAAVVLLVDDGDTILTSDPHDIERLLDAAGTRARIRAV
jgi:DNA-binding transcriptional MocR family regulator